MSSQETRSEFIFGSDAKPFTGQKMAILIGCFFATIIAVNITFSYFALSTWTGLETDRAYDEGVNYNKVIADGERQRGLKWRTTITANRTVDGGLTISASYLDQQDKGLNQLEVKGVLRRPTHEADDQEFKLTFNGNGRYTAKRPNTKAGNWRLTLIATTKDGTRYLQETRIWLKP